LNVLAEPEAILSRGNDTFLACNHARFHASGGPLRRRSTVIERSDAVVSRGASR
jgi:hypothetical protein